MFSIRGTGDRKNSALIFETQHTGVSKKLAVKIIKSCILWRNGVDTMAKNYRYELVVGKRAYSEEFGNYTTKIKRFLGNDKNELQERFEMWFIKQPYDRNDIEVYIGEVQHAGYRQ